MKLVVKTALGLALAACAFGWTSTSSAQQPTVINNSPPATQQQPVVVQQPPPASNTTVVAAEHPTEYAGPNRSMIATGLITFGISYGAAAIVAGTSNHQGDQHLYVPVAGPWMDLADRGSCGGVDRNGNLNPGCDNETGNKVLLVVDGIFQGLGVLSIIGGFVMPEERVSTVTTAKKEPPKPTIHVAPASLGYGAPGMAVLGTF